MNLRPSLRSRSLSLLLGLAAALALAAPSIPAQTNYGGWLDGGHVVPPTPSPAIGRGTFTLDPATNRLFYRLESNVVGVINAHVHRPGPGGTGPLYFTLAGTGSVWEGMGPVMGAMETLELLRGDFYVDIHTFAFPGGEIRAPLTRQYDRNLSATLTGAAAGSLSFATGSATLALRVPENVVIYRVAVSNLVAPPVEAHLHNGLVPLSPKLATLKFGGTFGPTSVWSGTTQRLSDAEVASLLAGNCAIDVHTAAYPAGSGEVLGAAKPTIENFAALGDGAQVVPPTPSPNTAIARFAYDPATGLLGYKVEWTGAGGTGAHLHAAVPGLGGALLAPLAGPANGPWSGSLPISPATATLLFLRSLYVDVHSAAAPGGEVRAVIDANPDFYGFAGPTSAGSLGRVLRCARIGLPILGNPSFGIGVVDALPGAFVSLGYAAGLAGSPMDLSFVGMPGHVWWADFVAGYPTAADGSGAAAIFFAVPASPFLAGTDYFFQWYSIDLAANAAGLVSSDAVRVTLQP